MKMDKERGARSLAGGGCTDSATGDDVSDGDDVEDYVGGLDGTTMKDRSGTVPSPGVGSGVVGAWVSGGVVPRTPVARGRLEV